MEISNGLRKILSWSIFPVLMILSLVITLYALQQKWDPPSIMVAVSAGATVLIILFERLIPCYPSWNKTMIPIPNHPEIIQSSIDRTPMFEGAGSFHIWFGVRWSSSVENDVSPIQRRLNSPSRCQQRDHHRLGP